MSDTSNQGDDATRGEGGLARRVSLFGSSKHSKNAPPPPRVPRRDAAPLGLFRLSGFLSFALVGALAGLGAVRLGDDRSRASPVR